MNKNELVEGIAIKTDSSNAQAERCIRAMLETISETLAKGESVAFAGFGTFEVRERSARAGRNPKTGEELKIAASKVPAFKPGATLKAAVNGSGE